MTIELAVSTIGSGKSTYAKEKAKQGWIILNNDNIVTSVHGGDYTLYLEELKPLYKSVEWQVLVSAAKLNKNIFIDKTNLTVESRKKYIDFALENKIWIAAILFPVKTPEWHARNRYESDNRGYSYDKWLEVATHHIKQYEKPTMDEGFDEIRDSRLKNGKNWD